MENFLATVIHNETFVLSLCVAGIAVCLLLILIFQFLYGEPLAGSTAESELRRRPRPVDDDDLSAFRTPALMETGAAQKIEELASEVLSKDAKIAELQSRITAGDVGSSKDAPGQSGENPRDGEDVSGLHQQIQALQSRLDEYAIIEDDIADLSNYKKINADLQAQLKALQTQSPPATEPASAPIDDDTMAEASRAESVSGEAEPEPEPIVEALAAEGAAESDDEAVSGASLVSEFERLVQGGGVTAPAAEEEVSDDGSVAKAASEYGEVMMARLEDVGAEPDSKEEADILIDDLKFLINEGNKNEKKEAS